MADKKKTGYQSPWEDQLKETANKILNREKFSYDLNGDALYKQYKDRYTQQGRQAMMDTMGQAAALTGGYGNSYAQSVGQQTYQGYMQGLTDKIPTLYQIALDKYTNEGNQMRDNMNLMMQQDEIGYGRYRDQVGDQQWQDTFDYSKARDQLSDQNNAYSKLMALMTGYGYKPSEAEMKAAGMSKAQRDAILKLGAYAPVDYEAPRNVPYVDPNAEDTGGGGDGINTRKIGEYGSLMNDIEAMISGTDTAGNKMTKRELNSVIREAVDEGKITQNQEAALWKKYNQKTKQ
jgi:hypothetical protein